MTTADLPVAAPEKIRVLEGEVLEADTDPTHSNAETFDFSKFQNTQSHDFGSTFKVYTFPSSKNSFARKLTGVALPMLLIAGVSMLGGILLFIALAVGAVFLLSRIFQMIFIRR